MSTPITSDERIRGLQEHAADLPSRPVQHFPQALRQASEFLTEFRRSYSADAVRAYLESFRSLRVLVVGEAILDEQTDCEVLGQSDGAPLLATRRLRTQLHPGGALCVANHLAEFCRDVRLVTYVGTVDAQDAFIRASLKPGVRAVLVHKPNAPTIVRRRYTDVESATVLLEVYDMNDEPLAEDSERTALGALNDALTDADLVVTADYGHGLITQAMAERLASAARFLAVSTRASAANQGFHTVARYPRADYTCLQEAAVRLTQRSRNGDLQSLTAKLAANLRCRSVLVTCGDDGTLQWTAGRFVATPTLATRVVDREGAEGAVLALTALCAARDVPVEVTGFIANVVAADAAPRLGSRRAIERARLVRAVESLLT